MVRIFLIFLLLAPIPVIAGNQTIVPTEVQVFDQNGKTQYVPRSRPIVEMRPEWIASSTCTALSVPERSEHVVTTTDSPLFIRAKSDIQTLERNLELLSFDPYLPKNLVEHTKAVVRDSGHRIIESLGSTQRAQYNALNTFRTGLRCLYTYDEAFIEFGGTSDNKSILLVVSDAVDALEYATRIDHISPEIPRSLQQARYFTDTVSALDERIQSFSILSDRGIIVYQDTAERFGMTIPFRFSLVVTPEHISADFPWWIFVTKSVSGRVRDELALISPNIQPNVVTSVSARAFEVIRAVQTIR